MSDLRLSRWRVLKNTASQVGAFGLSVGTKGLAAVVVARTLGPSGLGVFSLAWTLAGMLAFASLLGMDYRLIRVMSRTGRADELERTLPLACATSLAFAAVVVAMPVVVGADRGLRQALAASGVFIALSGPVLVFRAAFHARERMELETLVVGVEGAVALAGVGAVLVLGGGVVAILNAFGVARLANLLVSLVLYRRVWGRLRVVVAVGEWPARLRRSMSTGMAYIFTTVVFRFDVIVLALARPAHDLGIYTAATNVILTVPVVATALGGALYPVLARAPRRDDPELRRVFDRTWRLLVPAGIASAGLLSVFAWLIVPAVYGQRFGASVWVLAALAWVLPLRFVNMLLGVTLNAVDRHGRGARVVMAAVAFNLVSNVVLVVPFGYAGAVWSTLATDVVLLAVLLAGVRPLRPQLAVPLLHVGACGGVVGAVAAAGRDDFALASALATAGILAIAGSALASSRASRLVRADGVSRRHRHAAGRALQPPGVRRTAAHARRGPARHAEEER